MTARSTEEGMDLGSSQTMVDAGEGSSRLRSLSGATDGESDHRILAAENFNFSTIPGTHYDDVRFLLRNALHRNCGTVWQQATPRTSDLSTVTREFASAIATDMEARLSMAAKRKRSGKTIVEEKAVTTTTGMKTPTAIIGMKAPATTLEEKAPIPILKAKGSLATFWMHTGFPAPATSANSQHSDSSQHSDDSDDSELTVWEANKIAPCFESFVLFVAHHVKMHFSQRVATGLFQPEDCRLILPVANMSTEAKCIDFDSVDFVDPVDFAHVECGMFPFDSNVERQAVPAPHLIVADAEIAREKDERGEAEVRLDTRTNALYFNQHNRRFAWGLTASNRTIHAYVFGPDDIWASTAMDITSAEGRQALISLLVDWSLCPIDSLGLDPSIRYLVDDIGSPYLAIDVHEVDESTGKVGHCTYYSKRCVGAADRLTGCHGRCFAASSTPESMDKPTFLIKDVWTTLSNGSSGDTRESSFLKTLRDAFGGTDTSKGSFSHFVSAGPVYVNRGGKLVVDSTTTALAGLPSITQDAAKDSGNTRASSRSKVQSPSSSNDRQHRCTVSRWAGNMISAAANPSQVVIAIADAMVALNAAYVKCKILHGNLSDRAIQLQETADGIRGVLADFDNAFYYGASPDATKADAPEMMLFQSIRALERLVGPEVRGMSSREYALAPFNRLDDWECLFYIICVLGTFGINQAERNEYPAVESDSNHIKSWNTGNAFRASSLKRLCLRSAEDFTDYIASEMNGHDILRHLAVDMHRILFLHPECTGTRVVDGQLDPLARRNNFEEEIVAALLALMEQYRREALAALSATGATPVRAEQSAGPSKKRKLNADSEPGPLTKSRYAKYGKGPLY
ncbi:hypothetical protein GGI17_003136 [Coemansia sp. S146]|nr:hypothetical protein GGI17_003136 [Coemansia sp. S146]